MAVASFFSLGWKKLSNCLLASDVRTERATVPSFIVFSPPQSVCSRKKVWSLREDYCYSIMVRNEQRSKLGAPLATSHSINHMYLSLDSHLSSNPSPPRAIHSSSPMRSAQFRPGPVCPLFHIHTTVKPTSISYTFHFSIRIKSGPLYLKKDKVICSQTPP